MPPLLRSLIKLCVFCYLYSMASYSYSSSLVSISSSLISISSSLVSISSSVNNVSGAVINVGSYHCPPFVMSIQDNGRPQPTSTGLSILLWERIAESIDLQYEMQDYTLQGLLDAVDNGSIEVGISCITITPERELRMDFSHSFYETHLAIAVKQKGYLAAFINIITNTTLLLVVGIILICAGLIGWIFYLLEHKVNHKLYSMPSTGAQLLEAFILGLLFITKGPFNYFEFKTLSGRVLTVFLAIASTLFIASITAMLASTFTLGLLNTDIKSPYDLIKLNVGTKVSTTSSIYLESLGIIHQTFTSLDDMLSALNDGEIDAIVDDDAVLKYKLKLAKQQGRYQQISVLPYQFEKQNYGLAIKDNSPYTEQLNRALLNIRQSSEWQQALNQYFAEKY
ncbi:MAG: transporter substrate-binding domain-containing protein [Moritella sp.]|uniref:substrate-binding periplasmic protein n=1 Tax=Moritella sp. TaxID=78556 RepID=UPI001D8CFF03|nr:transporter substrate-binding domain-containing protein [Moritella sp.]NQZ52113.1 transporter substrate-binding domain-containing protein [Moritella sp.]